MKYDKVPKVQALGASSLMAFALVTSHLGALTQPIVHDHDARDQGGPASSRTSSRQHAQGSCKGHTVTGLNISLSGNCAFCAVRAGVTLPKGVDVTWSSSALFKHARKSYTNFRSLLASLSPSIRTYQFYSVSILI